jgi:protein-tyrosine-phosphatase
VKVLFVCIGNQGRSVLAERLFRRAAAGRHEARSAGSWGDPTTEIHQGVLEALAEVGIDASDHVPQKVNDDLIDWSDVVVSTCEGACPAAPDKRYVAWELPDPIGQRVDDVRPLRDDVERRVAALADELSE